MAATEDHFWQRSVERRLEVLERSDPAVLAERIRSLEARVERFEKRTDDNFREQDEEIGSLRRAIVLASVSIASTALIAAATVYIVFGQ